MADSALREEVATLRKQVDDLVRRDAARSEQVAELSRRVAMLEQRQPQGGEVPTAAEVNLLAQIFAFKSDRVFTANELLEDAQPLVAAPLLKAICTVVPDLSGRKVGRLLARLVGRDLGGYTVACVGECRIGAIWQVRGFAGL